MLPVTHFLYTFWLQIILLLDKECTLTIHSNLMNIIIRNTVTCYRETEEKWERGKHNEIQRESKKKKEIKREKKWEKGRGN